MHLIIILLTTVGVLTFLSGIIVLFGSTKSDRGRSIWYFLAALSAALWMASISTFLQLKPDSSIPVDFVTSVTFILALLLDIAFLGYNIWGKKYGSLITLIFLVFGVAISDLIIANPSAMYSEVIISNTGNQFTLNPSPLFAVYVLFFCLIVPLITLALLRDFSRSRSKRKRRSSLVVMTAYGTASFVVMISSLIMPLNNNCNALWLGPLAIGALIIAVYYAILRYQSLNLSYMWLRIFSYIVMVASLAIIYMIIFSIIFAALFMGSTPSTEVILLNFVMILIFIALIPAMTSLSKMVNSIISEQHPAQARKSLRKGTSTSRASSAKSTKSTKPSKKGSHSA